MLRGLLDAFFGFDQIQRSDFESVSSVTFLLAPLLFGFSFAVIAQRHFRLGHIFPEQLQRWWSDIFQAFRSVYIRGRIEGNANIEADVKESSKKGKDGLVRSTNTMSENPVSFVVGEPENDPTEELEVEDSFPSERNDIGAIQVQQNGMPGLLERRKRLRGAN